MVQNGVSHEMFDSHPAPLFSVSVTSAFPLPCAAAMLVMNGPTFVEHATSKRFTLVEEQQHVAAFTVQSAHKAHKSQVYDPYYDGPKVGNVTIIVCNNDWM